jgi:hypothetical protein
MFSRKDVVNFLLLNGMECGENSKCETSCSAEVTVFFMSRCGKIVLETRKGNKQNKG